MLKRYAFFVFIFTTVNLFAQTEIKFATVAPEGTTWMKVMREYSAALEKSTNGQVKFKIYGGSVQGDEKDVLRKIRINQLHSGGFTGVGLGEVLPEIRILDTPFLFRNKDEIDYISEKFYDRFAKDFEQKGFVLLGFAEVGWVYMYTNTPIHGTDDLKGVKMWMWEGDPIAQSTFEAFNMSPIPLSLGDVLTSLQTGLIDGVYTSPLACVSLQWFTKVKYYLDLPLTNSNGAVLISKRMFSKLEPDQQKALLDNGRIYLTRLTKLSREDNVKAKEEMDKNGLKKTEITDAKVLATFDVIGKKVRQSLVGRLYDQQLLDDITNTLAEYRKKK